MELDNLTLKDLKTLQALLANKEDSNNDDNDDSHFVIGKNYFIRAVTYHYIGTLVKVSKTELVLKDASWIASSGRFMNAVKEGKLSEVEPYPDGELVIIGRGAIVDASVWLHKLPRDQK